MNPSHHKLRCPGCGSTNYPSDPICLSCGSELPREAPDPPFAQQMVGTRDTRAGRSSVLNGTTVLLLGALSLILSHFTVYALLLGPLTWILANRVLAASSQRDTSALERGQLHAGRICGMISTGFLALFAALVVPLLGLGLLSGGRSAGAPTVRLNAPAPEVRLTDLAGREQTLGAYRGRLVLVNFFASW